ncbi:MAG: DUF1736 domain-containing protein [Bacteroidetes bacterium]|nr:DUF1736 domain-containing protein [Bacteroidota bacterium]
MAKQKPKNISQQKKQAQPFAPALASVQPLSPLKTFFHQSVFIVLVGFAIYWNSFNNKYALDDDIVMRLNEYVQQGFSGIGKIMSTDSYDSFFRSMGSAGELQGGRYRPLSIVTFAIEQQLFGDCYGNRYTEASDSLRALQQNPSPATVGIINRLIGEKAQIENKIGQAHEAIAKPRHITSVVLYIFSVVLLLWLLRDYIFKYANLKFIHPHDLAFLTSIIFLVHPIHTEVVSNVKSRDEILSFLFIVLAFIFVFKNEEKKETKTLALGMLFYFLALLSKEWAITLVALIPLALYIFRKQTLWQTIKTSLPYFAVAAFYMILRYKFVGAGRQGEITEVLNNPYVYANPTQKLATEIFVLVKYLRLLIFPHPLSADYSWKTIPYNTFGDGLVWLSIFVHTGIVFYLLKFIKEKHWLGFAIAFYLFHLFLVSNLAMPIGATMGERLIYHSSLGFAMAAAFFLLWLLEKMKLTFTIKPWAYIALVILLVIPMGFKTIERNPNWETDNILFTHDAWVVPNSVLANGNAGKAFIEGAQKDSTHRLAMLDSAIYHLDKAVTLHPKYVNGYLNLGLAWFQKKDLDKAEYYWNMARRYFPTHPFFRQSYDPALVGAFIERAKQEGRKGNLPLAIQFIARALKYDSLNAETWYHYGGANFQIGNLNEAYRGFTKSLQLNPNNTEARSGFEALKARMQQMQQPVNGKQ